MSGELTHCRVVDTCLLAPVLIVRLSRYGQRAMASCVQNVPSCKAHVDTARRRGAILAVTPVSGEVVYRPVKEAGC